MADSGSIWREEGLVAEEMLPAREIYTQSLGISSDDDVEEYIEIMGWVFSSNHGQP